MSEAPTSTDHHKNDHDAPIRERTRELIQLKRRHQSHVEAMLAEYDALSEEISQLEVLAADGEARYKRALQARQEAHGAVPSVPTNNKAKDGTATTTTTSPPPSSCTNCANSGGSDVKCTLVDARRLFGDLSKHVSFNM
eukprot:PhM_4_TR12545/c0_g1_i1/m.58354